MPGAYSEAACRAMFGEAATPTPFDSFELAFKAVESGEVDCALLPIENSLGGSIHANIDLLIRHSLFVCGEYNFRVRHALVALKGVEMKDIKYVMSHYQALAQCEEFIKQHNLIQRVEFDTAGSAQMIQSQRLTDTAAVCSELAAKTYDLNILQLGIEGVSGNFTRFLLLAREPVFPPLPVPSKTSLVISPRSNTPGVLFKALSVFALRELSLTKIESRPVPSYLLRDLQLDDKPATFQPLFYLDVAANQSDPRMVNALQNLAEFSLYIRVFGSYPLDLTAEAARQSNADQTPPPPLSHGLRVGLIGFGKFGQFLGKTLRSIGHLVTATSLLEDESLAAASLDINYQPNATQLIQDPSIDVLVFCVSVLSFESVLKRLPLETIGNKLVADVLSVKAHPRALLLHHLPDSCDIVCSHPMFGPESAKSSFSNLPYVYEQVRVRDIHRAHRWLEAFEGLGCSMVQMSCEQHDKLAAGSQFVTHLTGRMLARMELVETRIDTKGYKSLLTLIGNTVKDSWELFVGLYKYNPASHDQLRSVKQALLELEEKLIEASDPVPDSNTPQNGAASAGGVLRLSPLMNTIPLSETVEITDKAMQLRQQEGKDVISLSVGEPDFAPPACVTEAVNHAMNAQMTKYTSVAGTVSLRKAICRELGRKGLNYDPSQVLVSNGAKQSLVQITMATVAQGDTVLLPAPYWVSYTAHVQMCGGHVVPIETKVHQDFKLQADALESALAAHPNARMLILCNPCNPTGALLTKSDLEGLAAVLRRYPNVLIVSDEIYEKITYGVEHVSFATLPGMFDRTVVLNGVSKAFAMTGFRIGYLAGPKALVAACSQIQSQLTSCASSISQYASEVALDKTDSDYFDKARENLREKRDLVVTALRAIPNIVCTNPDAAFYVFFDVSAYIGKSWPDGERASSSRVLCMQLLERSLVAMVPGEAFGMQNFIRVSYATALPLLQTAMERLAQGFASLA
eukprot:c16881_g1_i2.p1 GENE.c16881_g1_i2~~c16881_g1_i2.p1  ORF type:complete len:970 (+),score=211.47 c16881_g1_i2:101-3010(+)